jgi:hypothetical protein
MVSPEGIEPSTNRLRVRFDRQKRKSIAPSGGHRIARFPYEARPIGDDPLPAAFARDRRVRSHWESHRTAIVGVS